MKYKLPDILNEVHWLIENENKSFLLTGSSPRKLRRSHANLLGGRAWRYTMAPCCFPELEGIELEKLIITGLLPPHIESVDPIQDLRASVADYLKEEIAAEAVVQNIPAFSTFLKVAAIMNGETLNYSNIARETGVSAKVIRSYFQILEDTLLGSRIPPWRKANNRKLVESEKIYLFDLGVANFLANRKPKPGTPEFGKSFEHYILMELLAYKAYKNPELEITYWRTSTGIEVGFILADMAVGIEVKSSSKIYNIDAKGLHVLQQEQNLKRSILVCCETEKKMLSHNVECFPWQAFLNALWSDEII
jgi:predicted AAA+ superfamily ATPase